jgi:deoxyuridine 5'-triphosphate nucleotidohydrolase
VSGAVATEDMEKESKNTVAVMDDGEEVMKVAKLGETAIMPVRGSPLSAGFDLSAAYDVVVPAHGKAIVKTDLAISIPVTCYARIAPRSGLAWKKHIDIGAGVVDADYRCVCVCFMFWCHVAGVFVFVDGCACELGVTLA